MTTDRRTAMASMLAIGAAPAALSATTGAHARRKPSRRITTEEHFLTPEYIDAVAGYMQANPDAEPTLQWLRNGIPPANRMPARRPMEDFDLRLADMDRDGIDVQVISLMQPGVQIFEPEEGAAVSQAVNDRIADVARAHPGRFAPLATIAPQAPDAAARELRRAVNTLGMHGAVINSHTKGEYLDDEKFWPILEAAESLDVPIYIHPREPAAGMFERCNYGGLHMIWGYGAETSLHALRLIFSGAFDVFPKLRIVLGHLGEAIPFNLDRIDNRFVYIPQSYKDRLPRKLKKLPGEYFRENFYITSSGQNWAPAVQFCQQVLGLDRVLFGADYPFEDQPEAVRSADGIEMSPADREKFFHENAVRVFKIKK